MKKRQLVIEERTDRHRRCGWRKAGGLYLVADGLAATCRQPGSPPPYKTVACPLPIRLDVCPTCGAGYRPARGWTWVNGTVLAGRPLYDGHSARGNARLLARDFGRCGLLWVGVRHYPRPAEWLAEAAAMGISQRVRTIPPDLELGRTWVMVAHRKAILNDDGSYTAAVFQIFRPRAVEYVVADDDSPEKLAALARRGVTLIRIRHIVDTPMFGTMPASRPARAKSPPPRPGRSATRKTAT